MTDSVTTPPATPPRRRWRRPTRRTVFKVITWTVVAVMALITLLGIWVYRESVGRFQVRKLRLPTRIYADFTPLRPGTTMGRDDLLEKLDRLGYREVETVSQEGEFVPGEGSVDIHTRSFTHPGGDSPGQAVSVTLTRSAIETVVAAGGESPVETAALEPELLTSVLSEQLENRSPVTLQQVPQHLQDAVVVTEDVRFWRHPGVDPLGILRAGVRNLRAGGVEEGGSTLTQQLVKNYFLTSERTYKRKIIEAFMAVILDARYSKREILEAYLNDIYLGRNRSISILGVGEASRFFFGKPIAEISIAEAATLAGMIRSPNNYSPFTSPEASMKRRNTVLQAMLRERKITQEQHDEARSTSFPKKPFTRRSGLSSMPYYVDRVLQELAQDYGVRDVKGSGLRIYTAIDLDAQDAAARVVRQSLESLEKGSRRLRNHDPKLQAALIHIDVPTGEIRALVGGRDYEESQFNRALRSRRLVGSLFKPFVYLTAFEPSLSNQNITPATMVSDTRFVLKRRWSSDWSPRNYDGRYQGNVTVRHAFEQSLNAASVRIGLASGVEATLKTARTLGVRSEMDAGNPSILLGAVGIPPIEMAESYTTIARQGVRLPMRAIRYVTDERGRVLEGAGDTGPVQVFPQRAAYLGTHLMQGVLDRGTAARARSMGFRKTAAGKTGTTNDKRDAWFIGFTPSTLALTWVGFDDNDPMGLSGSDAAVPMWTRFMIAATAGQPDGDFPVPFGIVFAEIDDTSGGRPTQYCPREAITRMAFKAGTEPMRPCPLHQMVIPPPPTPMYDEFGNLLNPDFAVPVDPGLPPVRPDTTWTGGVFQDPPPAPPSREPVPLPPVDPLPPTDTWGSQAPPPTRRPAPVPRPTPPIVPPTSTDGTAPREEPQRPPEPET